MGWKIAAATLVLILASACVSNEDVGSQTAAAGQRVESAQPDPSDSDLQPQPPAPRTPPPPPSLISASVDDRVFFPFNSHLLSHQAQDALQRQASFLRQYPGLTITIEGHCDERGTREYNLALGERRANSVREYLMALGIDPNRIGTLSYGKERPAVDGVGEAVWSQNRRAVTVIN